MTRRRKRNPWLAALLALPCAGLGDIYATRTRRGFATLAVYLGCIAATAVVLAVPPSHAFMLIAWLALIAMSLVVWIAGVVLGFLAARRAGIAPLTGYNRWYVYAGCIAAAVAVTNLGVSERAPFSRWQSFRVPSASMAPTILPGDAFVG